MKIIFVRHGESKHNVNSSHEENSDLTKKGRMQAEYLGRSLKNQRISRIYTSNLLRAKQTGKIISKIIKVPIKSGFEEFDEYPSHYLRSKFKILFNSRLRKLKNLLNKISKDRKKEKTILIVAHGITNRIIMFYLLQIPLTKKLLRFKQYNTGVNSMLWNDIFNSWNVEYFNNTSHLPNKLRDYSLTA